MPLQDYQLLANLLKEVEAQNVNRRDSGDYAIFKYSTPCVLERRWNKWNRQARGLIFHMPTSVLVARSLPKFFNLDENEESKLENLPQTPGQIWEKVDGSCIIVYMRDGQVRCSTPGSMDSTQAKWAEQELARRGLTTDKDFIELVTNSTPVMEAIYPENLLESELVVNYGDRRDLVLLACLDHDGHDWSPNRVNMLAQQFGLTRPRLYDLTLQRTMPEEKNAEGFVILWWTQEAALRVKYKHEPYKYLAKIVAGATQKNVLELLVTGAYGTLIESLPPHVRTRVDDIGSKLREQFYALKVEVETAYDAVKDLPTRKEQAAKVVQLPPRLKGLVFSKLDGKINDRSYWEIILKNLDTQ